MEMTTEEAICQLVREGILRHEVSREEADLGIATFSLVTSVTPELTQAMEEFRVSAELIMRNLAQRVGVFDKGSGV